MVAQGGPSATLSEGGGVQNLYHCLTASCVTFSGSLPNRGTTPSALKKSSDQSLFWDPFHREENISQIQFGRPIDLILNSLSQFGTRLAWKV